MGAESVLTRAGYRPHSLFDPPPSVVRTENAHLTTILDLQQPRHLTTPQRTATHRILCEPNHRTTTRIPHGRSLAGTRTVATLPVFRAARYAPLPGFHPSGTRGRSVTPNPTAQGWDRRMDRTGRVTGYPLNTQTLPNRRIRSPLPPNVYRENAKRMGVQGRDTEPALPTSSSSPEGVVCATLSGRAPAPMPGRFQICELLL